MILCVCNGRWSKNEEQIATSTSIKKKLPLLLVYYGHCSYLVNGLLLRFLGSVKLVLIFSEHAAQVCQLVSKMLLRSRQNAAKFLPKCSSYSVKHKIRETDALID